MTSNAIVSDTAHLAAFAAGFVWSEFVGECGGWSSTVGETEQIIEVERVQNGVRYRAFVVRIEDGETLAAAVVTKTQSEAFALLND